ncbi:MAG TPA: PQQ-dependent sugar dehydrogenase [Bacteriovoracaceae bacterium]|nr:PQQ-dependent sugar dehydrogenase [Bacteriovoracaceae bacterium]
MKLSILVFFFFNAWAFAQQTHYTSEGQKFAFEEVLKRKEVIWGLDFLPGKQFIFTERSGKMFLYDESTKKVTEVTGVPKVYAVGQGGLLDVKVHPDFAKNNLIFISYSEPVGKESSTTAVGKAVLKGSKLSGFKKIFTAHKPSDNDLHYGSRIAFDKAGHIFISVGERYRKDHAQDLSMHSGKIIRIKEDGSVPTDNPFVGKKGVLPEIYSYGHRNPQGLVIHPDSGEIWEAEMGPQGGDEVNLIKPGKNYGWPVITYGREYTGPKIGEGTHKEGMEQPIVYYVPSISPSGMAFYKGAAFPAWNGNLFLANLSGQHLRRIIIDKEKAGKEEVLLRDHGLRFRHVVVGPEGNLYVTTDNGIIGRIKPVIVSP